jgi:hypothetical protein
MRPAKVGLLAVVPSMLVFMCLTSPYMTQVPLSPQGVTLPEPPGLMVVTARGEFKLTEAECWDLIEKPVVPDSLMRWRWEKGAYEWLEYRHAGSGRFFAEDGHSVTTSAGALAYGCTQALTHIEADESDAAEMTRLWGEK